MELVDEIAAAIRGACPRPDECLPHGADCFRAHSVHAVMTREGRVTSVYGDVEAIAELAAAVVLRRQSITP